MSELEEGLEKLSRIYKVEKEELLKLLNERYVKKEEIILPYDGKIREGKCKAVVYNHGLYTQCKRESEEICKQCIKLKYGRIEERAKKEIGEYETIEGKREIDYKVLIRKKGYKISEVKEALERAGIKYELKEEKEEKKGRGYYIEFDDFINAVALEEEKEEEKGKEGKGGGRVNGENIEEEEPARENEKEEAIEENENESTELESLQKRDRIGSNDCTTTTRVQEEIEKWESIRKVEDENERRGDKT